MNNKHVTLLCLLLLALQSTACSTHSEPSAYPPEMPESMKYAAMPAASMEVNSAIIGEEGPTTLYKGKKVDSTIATNLDAGVVVPDGAGGVVLIPGEKRQPENKNFVNAKEFKLKIREMTEQLIAGISDKSLQNTVALPVSFVNVDNLQQSSSFGRMITEQLFYEFNQRGFPIKEYRITNKIAMKEGEGDFYLSREMKEIAATSPNAVVVAGTYYADKQSIVVNARLIRPQDGRVLRTANLVFQSNAFTRKMLGKTGQKYEEGSIHIRDYKDVTAPTSANPIDRGEDIH